MIKRFTPLIVILFFTGLPLSQISDTADLEADIRQHTGSSESTTSPVIASSDKLYNPFDFSKRIMMNICVHQFNYKERFLKEDIVNSFVQQQGYPPDTIIGNPKSTESGMLYGFWFKYMKRFHKTGIFIRPQFEFALGIENTYEGSTQAIPVSDQNNQITGIRFEPFETVKDNFFFTPEFDLGYSNSNTHLPFALYSGLRLGFWVRNMPGNEFLISYETFDWWSIPVGLIINKPVSNCWSLGCDATLDFVFWGGMMDVTAIEENSIDVPNVTLGNHCGYRLELCADGMLTEHVSLHFAPYCNLYRFGKSTTNYATDNRIGVSVTDKKIPFYEPESATFIAGMNITFSILMSRI